MNIGQFRRDFVDARRIDTKALICRQGLAREFEQDAFEDRVAELQISSVLIRFALDAGPRLSKQGIKKGGRRLRQSTSQTRLPFGAFVRLLARGSDGDCLPASPTLKRAKRRTAMFSPSLPIFVAISCAIEMVWSLMKGCSSRQTSS